MCYWFFTTFDSYADSVLEFRISFCISQFVCLNQIRGAHDKRFGAIWLSTADWLIKCGFIKLPFFFLHLIAYLIAGPKWQRIVILYHKRHIKCLKIAAILRFYCFLLYYYYFNIFCCIICGHSAWNENGKLADAKTPLFDIVCNWKFTPSSDVTGGKHCSVH